MNNYIELAKQYSKGGYSVIPVTSEKVPAIRDWGQFQTRPMTEEECEKNFANCWGIALLMGGAKCLTACDLDLKNDLSGDIFERFKKELPNELLAKMYVQSTKNNGYHFVFSSDIVEPNQKLASRYTTEYEKHETYMEAFKQESTRTKALKIALNDDRRVIFETRGGTKAASGGYVVMSPSPGYTFVYGKINKISEAEYHTLMDTARSFNDVIEKPKSVKGEIHADWEITPFQDYHERGDVVSVLLDSGWEECGRNTKFVRLKRAGNPKSTSSGLFNLNERVFNCFSTSTLFDVNKGYAPTEVFKLLECDNDDSVMFKKLIELGYGSKK